MTSTIGPGVSGDASALTDAPGSTGAVPVPSAEPVHGAVLSPLSLVVVHLLKGPLYRDSHEALWTELLGLRRAVADHVAVLGLVLMVDEGEGYAYLRSRPTDPGTPDPPRLVARRPLSFPVSMLLALLRKRLAEFDATSPEVRLVLDRDQIVDMLRLFLPDATNEARLVDAIDTHLNKVVELGFLRRLRGDDQRYEVRRILKAYVDGQWLADFDARLAEYQAQLAGAVGVHAGDAHSASVPQPDGDPISDDGSGTDTSEEADHR